MKKKQRVWMQMALGGLVGALAGFSGVYIGTHLLPKELLRGVFNSPYGIIETTAKLSLGLIALWAALAVHELGHLLTGLAQGFRFHLYVAGFLGIRRNPQSDRVEWYLNRDGQLFGGVAATLPTQQTTNLRQRFAWVVLAGPVSSLVTGVLALLLTYTGLHAPLVASSVLLRCVLVFGFIFSITSLTLLLATTLPNRTGVFYTDRARFFRLIRGGHTGAVEQAVLETLAHSMSGQPYGTLNKHQLDLLLSEKEPFFQTYAHTLAYYRHLDRQELTDAYEHIGTADELAHEQPRLFRQEIWKELAFAHAFIGKDTTLARQVWQQIGSRSGAQENPQAFLVQAAIALEEHRTADAYHYAQQGLEMLPKPVYKAEHKLYHRLLEQICDAASQPLKQLLA